MILARLAAQDCPHVVELTVSTSCNPVTTTTTTTSSGSTLSWTAWKGPPRNLIRCHTGIPRPSDRRSNQPAHGDGPVTSLIIGRPGPCGGISPANADPLGGVADLDCLDRIDRHLFSWGECRAMGGFVSVLDRRHFRCS